jgi:hypothetical protein
MDLTDKNGKGRINPVWLIRPFPFDPVNPCSRS